MLIKTEGKIAELICENDFFATLVMKKRVRGMIMPLVFTLKGEWKRACCDKNIFQEGDKIRIWFVPICKKANNNKYFTNLVIEKMEILEKGKHNLFGYPESAIEIEGMIIDEETGEIL